MESMQRFMSCPENRTSARVVTGSVFYENIQIIFGTVHDVEAFTV